MKPTIRTKQDGFTLVELLISAFVFSILSIIISGIFIQIVNNQRRVTTAQNIEENGLYVLEYMSREIRVSTIVNQNSPDCSLPSLTIQHPTNGTVVYSVSNGTLRRTANGVTSDLSNAGITFSRLNFCVLGSGTSDNQRSRVTIVSSIQNRVGREIVTFYLQTTTTSRDVSSE